MNKLFIGLLIITSFTLFSQDGIEGSYISEANRLYIQGEYEEAFSKVNQYFYVAEGDYSNKASILGEKIYYFYIRSLFSEENFVGIEFIEKSLNQNSQLKSVRVIDALNLLKNDKTEAAPVEDLEVPDIFSSNNVLSDDSGRVYSGDELEALLRSTLLNEESVNTKSDSVTLVLIVTAILVLIISLSIIFYILKVSTNRTTQKRNISPVLLGISNDSFNQLQEIISNCKKVGEEIDIATGRKNNSINTAELVYKISNSMGYSQDEALIYFASSMVHDIGLLSIDRDLLSKGTLSDSEFDKIKEHTLKGKESISFIPEDYIPIFTDACCEHHENLDGSGYPLGLKESDIPFIARVIRVVESYLSQISKRDYKNIIDIETAVLHLKEAQNVYDQKIVDHLYKVI